jgi:hypothetical protein
MSPLIPFITQNQIRMKDLLSIKRPCASTSIQQVSTRHWRKPLVPSLFASYYFHNDAIISGSAASGATHAGEIDKALHDIVKS